MRYRLLMLMMATCLAVTSGLLHAQELTVEDYIALTVDRLRIAEESWLQQGRAPIPAETDPLWSAYATTAEDYVAFGSRHRLAVASYLSRHPAVRDEIELRSQRIRALVSQTEPKP